MDKENDTLNESLDGFWTKLEFRLSDDLNKLDVSDLEGFWCDGIFLHTDDHQLYKKFINDNRQIQLIAWLGKTGQEKYDATIHFGPKAQSRYARGLALAVCIPENENNWFEVDVGNKIIDIYLL